jgi:hypothetical protein
MSEQSGRVLTIRGAVAGISELQPEVFLAKTRAQFAGSGIGELGSSLLGSRTSVMGSVARLSIA